MRCGTISKKSEPLWIWKAWDRASGQLVDWECGGRDKATCERLIGRLTRWRTRLYCADDSWRAVSGGQVIRVYAAYAAAQSFSLTHSAILRPRVRGEPVFRFGMRRSLSRNRKAALAWGGFHHRGAQRGSGGHLAPPSCGGFGPLGLRLN